MLRLAITNLTVGFNYDICCTRIACARYQVHRTLEPLLFALVGSHRSTIGCGEEDLASVSTLLYAAERRRRTICKRAVRIFARVMVIAAPSNIRSSPSRLSASLARTQADLRCLVGPFLFSPLRMIPRVILLLAYVLHPFESIVLNVCGDFEENISEVGQTLLNPRPLRKYYF
jgi:hypothetical protein